MIILTCKTAAVFTKVFLINTCFRVSIVLNIAHAHPATLIFLDPTSHDFHWLSCNFLEKSCLVIKSLFWNLRDLISWAILLTYVKFIWHAPSFSFFLFLTLHHPVNIYIFFLFFFSFVYLLYVIRLCGFSLIQGLTLKVFSPRKYYKLLSIF